MNAKIYLSLFRRSDKLLLLGFFVSYLFVGVMMTRPYHAGEMEANVLLLAFAPAFISGSALIEIWHRPLRLPATVLLPGLQRTLFRWHMRLILVAAFLWGSFLACLDYRIPWLAALGLSAACFTLPIYFTWGQADRQRRFLRESLLFWGVIIGINLPTIVTHGAARPLLAHIWISGAAGWAVLALNLRFACRQRRPASLMQHLLATKPWAGVGHLFAAWRRRMAGGKEGRESDVARPMWNYAPRKNSLFRQLQAAFQEKPTGLGTNAACCALILLIVPWVAQPSGGYPLAWYQVIFDPSRVNGLGAKLALIIALLASSLMTGLLRAAWFYPISRRQRLTIAFIASAVGFCCNFLVIAGGALFAGWLVGRWAGLPLPLEPAAAFLIRMAMVIPFMPLMRWGALYLETRQRPQELFLFVSVAAILVILSQSIVLEGGLRSGIVISLGSILASQWLYYTALREFYCRSDLVQRGARSQAFESA